MNIHKSVAIAVVVLSAAGLFLFHRHQRPRSAQAAVLQTHIPAHSPNQPAARMDIVFALDTTASMSALIEGAKAKIWDIARAARRENPNAELRFGLVAYRDKGDDYVTKALALTADLDKVYANLFRFEAGGGGDGPEHVYRALHDAIEEQPWSTTSDTVKLLYLVGDAPPHTDYYDGYTLERVTAAATARGIRIHAIRCGGDPSTLTYWTQIAQRTEGEVTSIAASGGVVVARSPYDEELARLNAQLSETEVHYGSSSEQRLAREELRTNVAAPEWVQADRASYYGATPTGTGTAPKKDLVASPKELAKVSASELPSELQSKTPAEREAYLEGKRVEREQVLARIRELSSQREKYLIESKPAPSEFDAKVKSSLKHPKKGK